MSRTFQIVSNILSIFAGAVSAIVGFYFGGRAAERKPEEKKEKPRPEKPAA